MCLYVSPTILLILQQARDEAYGLTKKIEQLEISKRFVIHKSSEKITYRYKLEAITSCDCLLIAENCLGKVLLHVLLRSCNS